MRGGRRIHNSPLKDLWDSLVTSPSPVSTRQAQLGIPSHHPTRLAASFPARSVANLGGNDRKSRTSLLGTPPLSSRVRLRGDRRWNRSADGISPKNFE